MPTILLINPPSLWPLTDYLEPDKIAAFPLGLAILAAALDEAGFDVDIIDCVARNIRPTQLQSVLPSKPPRVIGITVPFATVYTNAVTTAKMVKAAFPNATVILGGNHVTYMPEKALEDSGADIVCLYEGDFAIVEITRALIEQDRDITSVPGLVLRESDRATGACFRTSSRVLIDPLDTIPMPDRTRLDPDDYSAQAWNSVIVTRGCFGRCGFCSTMKFNGKRVRAMSFARVLAECRHAIRTSGLEYVNFFDDLFTHSYQWVTGFLREKANAGDDFEWGCMSRVDTVSENLLTKMHAEGCRSIFFGVKACSEAVFRSSARNMTSIKRLG